METISDFQREIEEKHEEIERLKHRNSQSNDMTASFQAEKMEKNLKEDIGTLELLEKEILGKNEVHEKLEEAFESLCCLVSEYTSLITPSSPPKAPKNME